MKRAPWAGFALVVVAATLGLVGSGAAQSQAALTLEGEFLVANTVFHTVTATVVCNPEGTSTISQTASGIAAGPYPGTFTETATIELGPNTLVTPGEILSAQADFRIESGDTIVTGTKSLAFPVEGSGVCQAGDIGTSTGCPDRRLLGWAAGAIVDYQATIRSPSGTFTDAGTATLGLNGSRLINKCPEEADFFFAALFEGFLVSGGPSAAQASGGGEIRKDDENPVSFGFTAQGEDAQGGMRGHCAVVDHASGTQIRCLGVTAFSSTANVASWSGPALVDGVETTYEIDVMDNGEPGKDRDFFKIQTGTGQVFDGVLSAGDIQVKS